MYSGSKPRSLIKLVFLSVLFPLPGCGQQSKKLTGDSEAQAAAANRKGVELYKAARFKDAVEALDEAIRLDSNEAVYYFNRGGAKCGLNDWDGAINDLNQAIEMDPDQGKYHGSRGYAFYKKGKFDKAIQDHMSQVRLNPKDRNGYFNLARIYGTCLESQYRDGKKAVENALRACELDGWESEVLLATLAAAYAETGDFTKAIEWQQKALDRAPSFLVGEFQSRMDLYRRGKPYREDWSKKDFE